ncbi:MAG: acylneuraminate cytidylyltransferase family protein [Lentisphaeria bacterium]|nr:acylneuraminate cytidylyltransferase family protein [Lentisphaeria bacterium]
MNLPTLTAFLPCRAGSERVKKKNVRAFAGIDGGLTRIKLEQLLNVRGVGRIILSTDDQDVAAVAVSIGNERIEILGRPAELASSTCHTDALIRHIPDIIADEHILWTHVTSPFVNETLYEAAIAAYFTGLQEGKDSLMSVTKIQKFLWDDKGPMYDTSEANWPRTQTIHPIYEVNSGIFIANRATYVNDGNRIGKRPVLFEIDDLLAFDIDWEHDFELAELLWDKRHGGPKSEDGCQRSEVGKRRSQTSEIGDQRSEVGDLTPGV